MRIRNADGGEVDACGNATRCIGAVLLDEVDGDEVRVRTGADLLTVKRAGYGLVSVDMGVPRGDWDQIPLAAEADTLHLDLACGPLDDPAAVSMGNPYAISSSTMSIPYLSLWRPGTEVHPVFPNEPISASPRSRTDRMRLRVWERGVG